ncbi:hypothetical protein EDC02_2430 [Micromonospora sp. Llam0]|nr:hypothetical protein EDC02_2430 [Micromonospora sp. Llam0]
MQLTVELAGTGAQIVVRVRDDRAFYARPVPRVGGRGGAPRRHGAKVSCADPGSWPGTDARLEVDDEVYGRVQVSAWHRLHPKQRTYRGAGRCLADRRGHPDPAAGVAAAWPPGPGAEDGVAVVARPDLVRSGPGPGLALLSAPLRYRAHLPFRQAGPGLDRAETAHTAAGRPVDLADPGRLAQLRLARFLVADHRLPWQRPQPVGAFTPGRVRRGFGHLLPAIGTPASAPKPTQPSPGRPKGSRSTPAPHHPATKKSQVKTPNGETDANRKAKARRWFAAAQRSRRSGRRRRNGRPASNGLRRTRRCAAPRRSPPRRSPSGPRCR